MPEKTVYDTEVVDEIPRVTKIPTGTVASVINIPPQIATTVCWVAVGFALCWWLTGKREEKKNSRGS